MLFIAKRASCEAELLLLSLLLLFLLLLALMGTQPIELSQFILQTVGYCLAKHIYGELLN